ncbi:THAP domain-containing protein 2-like [Rhipicephalus sanguineus]|uniref:THAP domain-containing protein 2-like n=1 Tax=Rhipicephalus sanguineus TaxID=34632 RepID=UPI0020C2F5DE|nr:THAP domain-containing protein 2-like [Rhipicephalus sanguineus]
MRYACSESFFVQVVQMTDAYSSINKYTVSSVLGICSDELRGKAFDVIREYHPGLGNPIGIRAGGTRKDTLVCGKLPSFTTARRASRRGASMYTSLSVAGGHVRESPDITGKAEAVFPKDVGFRSAWERAVRREGWTPKKNDVLCSQHFEEDCFDRTGQTTRLRAGSIPTVFAAFPAHLRKPEKRKRAPPKNRETPSPEAPVTDEAAEVSTLQTSTTKEWYRQKVHESANEVQQLKKKIKTLQQNKRRLSKRIDASKDLIDQLKEQNLLSEKGSEVFQASFSPDIQQLLK